MSLKKVNFVAISTRNYLILDHRCWIKKFQSRCFHSNRVIDNLQSTQSLPRSPSNNLHKLFYSKFTAREHCPRSVLSTSEPLSEEGAHELVLALSDDERSAIKIALSKYEANEMKQLFEGI